MTLSLTVLAAFVGAPAPGPCPEVSTEFWQVAPECGDKPWTAPAAPSEKARAVVLIHGLYIHPVQPARATRPWRRSWQDPKSEMVTALAKDSDVFAFAYAQMTPVDDVAPGAGLRNAVARLRKAGYTEVVLIGHSAGGIVARQFVENYPDAGVTKVIAVAAPFSGLEAATLGIGYRKVQAPFVESLAPEVRIAATRANKNPFPAGVEFACVVCKLRHLESDILVPVSSQWPADLQALGVPAVVAHVNHFEVVHNAGTAKVIAGLVRDKLSRWGPGDVARARKVLFGEPRYDR